MGKWPEIMVNLCLNFFCMNNDVIFSTNNQLIHIGLLIL